MNPVVEPPPEGVEKPLNVGPAKSREDQLLLVGNTVAIVIFEEPDIGSCSNKDTPVISENRSRPGESFRKNCGRLKRDKAPKLRLLAYSDTINQHVQKEHAISLQDGKEGIFASAGMGRINQKVLIPILRWRCGGWLRR